MVQLTEKGALLELEAGQLPIAYNPCKKCNCGKSKWVRSFGLLAVCGLVYHLLYATGAVSISPYFLLAGLGPVPLPVVPVVEVFEVAAPVTLPLGAYAASDLLFDEEALTDGVSADFETPAVFNFTGAFLTLNLTNNDTTGPVAGKSPLVAEISIGDYPIWRTSTPGSILNAVAHSSSVKNVTEFLSLFEANQTVDITFLEGDATDVTVSLELTLFNDTTTAAAVPKKGPVTATDIFSFSGPATNVISLGKAVKGPKFSVVLPQSTLNTTAAKLSLFAHATEDEVEYYKHDLSDASVNGPIRQLHVFANSVFIGSISPKPTLYHSDLISANPNASALWSPLADTGSFLGLSYDLDLLPVLPLLWAGDVALDVVVVSPIDAATSGPGLPPPLPHPVSTTPVSAASWFISGNVFTWESPAIVSAVGAVLSAENSQLDSGLVIAPPATSPWQPALKNEIIKSKSKAGIAAALNFTLVDNSTLNYTLQFNASTFAVLTKSSKTTTSPVGPPGSGSSVSTGKSSLVSVSGNKLNYEITDVTSALTVLTKNITADFPFTLSEQSKTTAFGPTGPATSLSLTAEVNSDIKTKVNGVIVQSYKVKEKLSADAIVGADTDIKVKSSAPGQLPFSKEVEAINGIVTKETVASADFLSQLETMQVSDILDATF